MNGIGVTRPASLVGYSYGAFVAATTALVDPSLVDRLVLIAPAAVLAPIEFAWLWRAMVYGLLYQGPWFTKYMAADPNFDYERDIGTVRHKRFMESIHRLGSVTTLAVPPVELDDTALSALSARHRTLVVVGEHETVTNHSRVVASAQRNGIAVELVPRAGCDIQRAPIAAPSISHQKKMIFFYYCTDIFCSSNNLRARWRSDASSNF